MLQQHRHSYQRFLNTCWVSNTSVSRLQKYHRLFFSQWASSVPTTPDVCERSSSQPSVQLFSPKQSRTSRPLTPCDDVWSLSASRRLAALTAVSSKTLGPWMQQTAGLRHAFFKQITKNLSRTSEGFWNGSLLNLTTSSAQSAWWLICWWRSCDTTRTAAVWTVMKMVRGLWSFLSDAEAVRHWRLFRVK